VKSALNYLFQSENADDIIAFLRSRGERAHIISPDWVQQLVLRQTPSSPAELSATWSNEAIAGSDVSDKKLNYIVVAEDAAEERAIAATLQDRRGIKVYGLFRHVLPALLCGANGMAGGRSTRGIVRYALLCIPRSGSRYLAAVLGNRGVGAPREHIREPFANVIVHGKLGFAPAIAALEKFGQRNQIFGTKLISTFLIKASHGRMSEITANLGWMVDRGYRFMRLERPLTEAVVSSYIAFLMRKWHFFQELDEASRARLDGLAFDEGAAWEEYIRFRAEHIVIHSVAGLCDVPAIRYSDIQTHIDDVVERVCGHLQVDAHNLEHGSAPIPLATRSASLTYATFSERLRELLENRRNDLDGRTINKVRALTALNSRMAERLVADAGPQSWGEPRELPSAGQEEPQGR